MLYIRTYSHPLSDPLVPPAELPLARPETHFATDEQQPEGECAAADGDLGPRVQPQQRRLPGQGQVLERRGCEAPSGGPQERQWRGGRLRGIRG